MPLDPCGRKVSLLRSCYRTKMRFGPGPQDCADIEWIWADPDAEWLGIPTAFVTRNVIEHPYPDIGEVDGARRTWTDGFFPLKLPGINPPCGSTAVWLSGSPTPIDPIYHRDRWGFLLPCCVQPTGPGLSILPYIPTLPPLVHLFDRLALALALPRIRRRSPGRRAFAVAYTPVPPPPPSAPSRTRVQPLARPGTAINPALLRRRNLASSPPAPPPPPPPSVLQGRLTTAVKRSRPLRPPGQGRNMVIPPPIAIRPKSFIQFGTGINTSSLSSITYTWDTGTTVVGNLISVAVAVPNGITVTPPSELSFVEQVVGATYTVLMFDGVCTSATGTLSFGLSSASEGLALGVEIHGQSSRWLDQHSVGFGTSTTANAGSVTTTYAKEIAVFWVGAPNAAMVSPPTGFTSCGTIGTLPDGTQMGAWYNVLSSTSTLAPSISFGGSEQWEAVVETYF